MDSHRPPRILFVDDEPFVLDALRCVLRRRRRGWEMVFAESAHAALIHLRAGHFDAVVSDMRMPKMDGAELLEHVRAEFPGIGRILLSGQAQREAVERALSVCHEFLSKPCDPGTLTEAIERACGMNAPVELTA